MFNEERECVCVRRRERESASLLFGVRPFITMFTYDNFKTNKRRYIYQ
jgi:hypothetical protein